jgi:recombination protein RecA
MNALSPEVNAWINERNKKLGPNTVVLASDIVIPKRFTTGSLSLDVALGGGWPGNQWVEVIGHESSGKTALVFKTIAANQAIDKDFTTFWLASEHYDTDQAAALGVDNDRVVVTPTQDMELGLDFLLDAAESKLYDCLVLDSYPAMLPDQEDENAMNEATVAAGAKLFNKFWRKAGKATRRNPDGTERVMLGLVINQFRDKIGTFQKFGKPETSPGGHGKDYAFYVRLKLARAEWIEEKRAGLPKPVSVGQVIVVETIKNKSAAPRQRASIDFYFRNAITTGYHRGDYDLGKEYVAMGVLFDVIQLSGSWHHYDGHKWNSKAATEEAIREDRGLQEKLAAEVLEAASDLRRLDSTSTRAPAPKRRRASGRAHQDEPEAGA